ncbi:MAG: hypothetical protein ACRDHN_12430 [Thermomicrobiales bacterium]
MSARHDRYDELLHREWYTANELAELLDLSPNSVTTAVFEKRLHATVIDGHILEITRHDALKWLADEAREA